MYQNKKQKVSVGETFDYHWPDQQDISRYTVLEVESSRYRIRWETNGYDQLWISFGCPLNYDAIKVQANDT